MKFVLSINDFSIVGFLFILLFVLQIVVFVYDRKKRKEEIKLLEKFDRENKSINRYI